MLKIVPPGAFDFGEPPLRLVKWGRGRMGSNDRRELLKYASEGFVAKLAQLERHPGEELAHNIALGTTERFGSNRNGDGFRQAVCRECHPTFVKYGRAFREHINKDPRKSYGVIKFSYFNEPAQRVELGIAYNSTKEAAEHNRGLVASEELEALEKDGTFATSMACIEPYDTCSGCGHKAKSRDEYCHGSMCKYGGLKTNIGKTFDDGHTLHADNPASLKWFDLSKVGRGADRISHTLGLIEKAAGAIKSGAELAELVGLTMPSDFMPCDGPAGIYMKLASELSSSRIANVVWAAAFSRAVQPPIETLPDLQSHSEKLAYTLRALADEQIVLPLREFLTVMLGDPKTAADTAATVTPYISGAYADLLDQEEPAFTNNSFIPSDGAAPHAARQWAAKLAADYSLARPAVKRRLALASIRGVEPCLNNVIQLSGLAKSASAIRSLARQYALYKLAALRVMQDSPDREWLLLMAAVQDRAAE